MATPLPMLEPPLTFALMPTMALLTVSAICSVESVWLVEINRGVISTVVSISVFDVLQPAKKQSGNKKRASFFIITPKSLIKTCPKAKKHFWGGLWQFLCEYAALPQSHYRIKCWLCSRMQVQVCCFRCLGGKAQTVCNRFVQAP